MNQLILEIVRNYYADPYIYIILMYYYERYDISKIDSLSVVPVTFGIYIEPISFNWSKLALMKEICQN